MNSNENIERIDDRLSNNGTASENSDPVRQSAASADYRFDDGNVNGGYGRIDAGRLASDIADGMERRRRILWPSLRNNGS